MPCVGGPICKARRLHRWPCPGGSQASTVRVEINETDGRATGVTYVREGDGVERHQRARAVALAGLFDRVELPGYPGGSDLGRQLATLLFGQRDPRVLVGRAPVILQKRPSGRTAPSVGFPPRHHCGHAARRRRCR